MEWDGRMGEWHWHPDARTLLAYSQIENLPGLSETVRNTLVRVKGNRKPKANIKGHRYGWWPSNVRDYCCNWGEKGLAQWRGIGPGVIKGIRAALARVGLETGMTHGTFGDWQYHILHDPNIKV